MTKPLSFIVLLVLRLTCRNSSLFRKVSTLKGKGGAPRRLDGIACRLSGHLVSCGAFCSVTHSWGRPAQLWQQQASALFFSTPKRAATFLTHG
ncbi:uncharacterized protein ARMOST_00790 [Armillaria ostoyae]|uniref:Secreted protein n=1 Tax=Armillaria ostoyae TaxID=47428 RepID=A0A284QM66_ARMOS|nr:uncharacterized protein ARMOST_00790 [Armillaria ostoyae]